MQWLAFLLNLPWTFIGMIGGVLGVPRRVTFSTTPIAIIFYVKNIWWYRWLPGKRHSRGIAIGQFIALTPLEESKDLEHELIHVEQAERAPFIQPFLMLYESVRHGYRDNKYEQEAYTRSGNEYRE